MIKIYSRINMRIYYLLDQFCNLYINDNNMFTINRNIYFIIISISYLYIFHIQKIILINKIISQIYIKCNNTKPIHINI